MSIVDAARKVEDDLTKAIERGTKYRLKYEAERRARIYRDKQNTKLKTQLAEANQEIGGLNFYIEQHRKAAA